MRKIFIALVAVLILLIGCQGLKPTTPAASQLPPASITATAEPLAKVEAYSDILIARTQEKPKEAIAESKPLLEAQGKEIDATKDELQNLKTSIEAKDKEHNRQITEWVKADEKWKEAYADKEKELEQAKNYWGYQWGKWIDNVIRWITYGVIGLIIITVAGSALSGVAGPVGLIATFLYKGIALNIWTGGVYAIGRLFRWIVSKWTNQA